MNPTNVSQELLFAGYTLAYSDNELRAAKDNAVYTIKTLDGVLMVYSRYHEPMGYENWCFINRVQNLLSPASYKPGK
jgi:hypothetical protein